MTTFTPQKASADIGVCGLGVMGANRARNLVRNGYRTAIFNRTPARSPDSATARLLWFAHVQLC